MALIKTKTLESGISGGYWVVTGVSLRFAPPETDIYLGLWLDQQAFLDGRQPVLTSVFQSRDAGVNAAYFGDAVLRQEGKSPAIQAQAYLKGEVGWFADAVDTDVFM